MDNIAGEGCEILIPFNERKPIEEIERSLIKTYRKPIWSKFVKAIKDYNLIDAGDKIAVAISGGKDSLIMAKLFQELQRHGKVEFELEYIAMDPGYHKNIKDLLVDNCKHLNIPVKIFESRVFDIIDNIARDYPCYMCAKMRRGALYAKAQELGCNKLALGHHFNDVIETTMLNVFYSGNFKTMLPKLKAQNFKKMELIRPLYYIEEEDIEKFTQDSGIWPLNCACMVAAKKIGNKRNEIKDLVKQLKKNFSGIDKSIFRSTQNVNMDSILGWQKNSENHSYLEFYDED
ncbi:MAG: tRNA 2-thiocytidine biosynthesis TtcA family protein [Clostridium sp.]|uniref:tRNA 2-thiocytidine biosynthesis TtcA family protein n=1 Tax=Clostridium sp. TaxID=1506 RepID=UPI003D6C7E5C